jgi:hypothetical protein
MINKSYINTLSLQLIVLCLFLTVCGAENTKNYPLTPEAVVQKFCELDAKGDRLSADTMNNISHLVAWTDEGGEVMFVIDSFTVGKAAIKDGKATVPVHYTNLGSTDFIDFSMPSPKWVNPYVYQLVLKNGKWKMDAPVSAPHVDWKTAITYLRRLQKREPARQASLENIIRKIDKARKQLHKNKQS